MVGTKRKVLCILLVMVLIGTAFITYDPKVKAEKFVGRWGTRVEESLASGEGVPAGIGEYRQTDVMIEFPISASGFGSQTSYYGCYYSYEDTPIAVQDLQAKLLPSGEGIWSWQSEGDNHGVTEKIRAHWYYYEMHF